MLSNFCVFFFKYSSLEIFHKIVLRKWSFRLSFVANIKQSLGEKGQEAERIGCSADGDLARRRETMFHARATRIEVTFQPTPFRGMIYGRLIVCVRGRRFYARRFKWEINIKRPFTAPSNKQLDSSFWYAPFLRPLSTLLGVASRVQISNASTPQRFTLKRRFVFSDLFLFKHAIASVSSFLQISSLQFLKF